MALAEIGTDFNINTLIALGALGIAGVAIVIKLLDKSVSLREHNEFKNSTSKRLDEIQDRQDQRLTLMQFNDYKDSIEQRANIRRIQYEDLKKAIEGTVTVREFSLWRDAWVIQVTGDFDRIEEDLRLINSAKPSHGELQEAMKAVDARVTHMEQMIRDIKSNHK